MVPTGIVTEIDQKCKNSRQVGMGPMRHPEVQNGSEGRFLRRHEVGGQVWIRVPPEQAADQRLGGILLQVGPSVVDINGEYRGGGVVEELEKNEGGRMSIDQ